MSSAPPAGVEITILRSRPDVAELAPEWDRLSAATGLFSAFASPTWFLHGAEKPGRPFVVIARRDGDLAAVLPLFQEGPGATATFVNGLSDYNDVIVADENEGVTAAVLRAAAEACSEGLVLGHLRADSVILRSIDAPGVSREPAEAPFIELPESIEAYLHSRSRWFRRMLRKQHRHSAEAGLEIREILPGDADGRSVTNEFLALHLERHPDSVFRRPEYHRFITAALPQLFAEGKMRVFAGRQRSWLAIDLCVESPAALGCWNGGFTHSAARFGVGNLLHFFELSVAIREKRREYDWLRGIETYKDRWATGRRTLYRAVVKR